MKCSTKFLVTLCAFFFGTFSNIVKADDGEMKHIVGISCSWNVLNLGIGITDNLKKLAGFDDSDNRKYEFTLCWPLGIEGIIDYDLYFWDIIALSAIIKGGWNHLGNYNIKESSSVLSSFTDDEKKIIQIKGGNVDVLVGTKLNLLPNGLSFVDGNQEGLRFAICGHVGMGFNFGSPEIGEDTQLKDKVDRSLLSLPVTLDFEFVSRFSGKTVIGFEWKFLSPIKATDSNKDNGKNTVFSSVSNFHLAVGYDLGAIING